MFVLESIKTHAAAGRTALVNGEETLSFAELDACSERFAAWLLGQFGDDRTPVVLYGHKQSDLLPCIYGALKAGRAYVPVDFATPPERAGEIVADIAPRVVVDFSGKLQVQATVLGSEDIHRILLDGSVAAVPREQWVAGDDTVYILFTSGSTGKPKGVPITVRNLTNFRDGLLPYMPQQEGGVILNQISYSFDVSGCSLYVGLSRGMTLFTVDNAMMEQMGAMLDALQSSGLTMWVSTPSFAEICVQSRRFSAEMLPALERILFCGEVLTHKLCDTLAERFAEAKVINTYGPTEATVLVTAVEVTGDMRRDERPIPIGYPTRGVTLRVVDAQGEELAGDGQCGELLIVGESVGPGYHNRPDLTAARFFTEADGRRGYRTGDICYRMRNLYYYSGRTDNQLKLNGFRIEIEDIENNMMQVENVARAAVVPVWQGEKVQYLVAFLLLEDAADGLAPFGRSIQIKKQAAAFLPAYMIPRKLLFVEAFPLNVNGKVDKKALAGRLQGAEEA